MSKNREWIETKQERELDEKGEFITKKITRESIAKPRTIWGIEPKDFGDLLIKFVGLTAIAISIAAFVHTLNTDRENEKQKKIETQEKQLELSQKTNNDQANLIEQLKRDSVANITADKRNKADNKELQLKQIEILDNQIANSENLKEKQIALEKSLANSLESISLNKQVELDKEKALLQLQIYIPVTSDILSLLNKSPNDANYNSTKEHLYNDLFPKIVLINDNSVLKKLKTLMHFVELYYVLSKTYDQVDSLNNNVSNLFYTIKRKSRDKFETIDILNGLSKSVRYTDEGNKLRETFQQLEEASQYLGTPDSLKTELEKCEDLRDGYSSLDDLSNFFDSMSRYNQNRNKSNLEDMIDDYEQLYKTFSQKHALQHQTSRQIYNLVLEVKKYSLILNDELENLMIKSSPILTANK